MSVSVLLKSKDRKRDELGADRPSVDEKSGDEREEAGVQLPKQSS